MARTMATAIAAHILENPETGERYNDKKRYLWASSALYTLAPAIFVALAYTTGWAAFLWATPILFYGLVAILDHIVGEDEQNPPDWAVQQLEDDRFFRWVVYAGGVGHFITLFVGAWAFTSGLFPVWALAGLVLSVGLLGGLAINTAHELGHKKTREERWVAKIVLAIPAYGHFFIEHNKGHHRDVATPDDPASARMGENLYGFAFLREIPLAARRAWRIECERLQRKGAPVFGLQNEIVQTSLMALVLHASLIAVFGWAVLPLLLAQAVFGYFLLSQANYVEHYGLRRQKSADGRFERCKPEHSWNTNHIMSNLVLFHLQRHSDHHANPTRRYQGLRDYRGVPRLPSGYPGMFLLALVPPLWRVVMDKRVAAHYDYDLTQVNVAPDKRDALFARYHRPDPNNEALQTA